MTRDGRRLLPSRGHRRADVGSKALSEIPSLILSLRGPRLRRQHGSSPDGRSGRPVAIAGASSSICECRAQPTAPPTSDAPKKRHHVNVRGLERRMLCRNGGRNGGRSSLCRLALSPAWKRESGCCCDVGEIPPPDVAGEPNRTARRCPPFLSSGRECWGSGVRLHLSCLLPRISRVIGPQDLRRFVDTSVVTDIHHAGCCVQDLNEPVAMHERVFGGKCVKRESAATSTRPEQVTEKGPSAALTGSRDAATSRTYASDPPACVPRAPPAALPFGRLPAPSNVEGHLDLLEQPGRKRVFQQPAGLDNTVPTPAFRLTPASGMPDTPPRPLACERGTAEREIIPPSPNNF